MVTRKKNRNGKEKERKMQDGGMREKVGKVSTLKRFCKAFDYDLQ